MSPVAKYMCQSHNYLQLLVYLTGHKQMIPGFCEKGGKGEQIYLVYILCASPFA